MDFRPVFHPILQIYRLFNGKSWLFRQLCQNRLHDKVLYRKTETIMVHSAKFSNLPVTDSFLTFNQCLIKICSPCILIEATWGFWLSRRKFVFYQFSPTQQIFFRANRANSKISGEFFPIWANFVHFSAEEFADLGKFRPNRKNFARNFWGET
jgi:hypothetical protein